MYRWKGGAANLISGALRGNKSVPTRRIGLKPWKKLLPFPSFFLLISTSEFMVNYFYKSFPSCPLHSIQLLSDWKIVWPRNLFSFILSNFSTSLKGCICSCKFNTSPGFKLTFHLIKSPYWPSYSEDA